MERDDLTPLKGERLGISIAHHPRNISINTLQERIAKRRVHAQADKGRGRLTVTFKCRMIAVDVFTSISTLTL
jgi:hypothetical protein